MALRPTKPQKGDKVLQSLYNTVCDIVDYLPSLEVRGDNKTISVSHSTVGTTIKAVQPNSFIPSKNSKGEQYTSGKFIRITSGNAINCILTGGTNIEITPAGVINYTGSGGGGSTSAYYDGRFIKISGSNTINSTLSGCGIVAANLRLIYDSGMVEAPPNYYITINETADANGYNIISCDLTHLTQLYNYSLTPNAQASVGSVNMDHYMKAGDFFLNNSTGNRGLGTQIGLYRHSIGNTVIDPETGEQHLVNPIMGLKVDLTVSGGTWISTSGVPRKIAGFDVDPEDLQINCLLTGTYNHSPHTSGFIDVVPVQMEDGKTWGVISTNLHGDGTTIDINPIDGTISCKVGTGNVPTPVANTVLSATSNGTMQWTANTAGGQGGGGGCFWPMWENLCGSGNIVLVKTWYTTSTGGWLRISNKTGTTVEGCNSVYIDPVVPPIVDGKHANGVNHIGLGTGINSHFLPVPPGSSFYIEYPSGDGTRCWFDGSTSPNKTNTAVIEGSSRIINASNVAVEKAGEAQSYYNTAYSNADSASGDYTNYIGRDNIDPPTSYKDWYYNAYNASNTANTAADEARQAAISCQNVYNIFTAGGGTISDSYVTNAVAASGQAAQYADDAHNMVLTAGYYYDLCYNHYQTCPNHSGWFADNPDFERYDN